MPNIELTFDNVPVRIMDGPYLKDGKPSVTAVKHYKSLVKRLPELRAFAAKELCSLYNDTWLDESIGTVDEKRFAHMLTNPSIHLFDEVGASVVYFDDAGLFAGHSIEVSVEDGTPTSADIIG
ncbi:DUF2262 domain-containing protein [Ereboglobus luteus]|uniref:DUF2262 domain-containing protein n=1 Tax=Ereboglobus luteus TaxID=1796921 RepID=A0A2U8E137_9BACT|nr:DUF2262 domain-containing protein [Ereboglobus luteus]AWI08541.1 hypothetical protein CKA38_04095 [Ereboglobus luteus]